MSFDPQSVRRTYDVVAGAYADALFDELDGKPLDRALLAAVAEDVGRTGGGVVGDLGAGPGHVAAHLTRLGVTAVAVDLSPAMATLARTRAQVPAVAGSFTALPLWDGALAGAVAPYSLIHLDDQGLTLAASEVARVVRVGGPLLVAFHAGTEVRHLDDWFDRPVDIDFRFLERQTVVDLLAGAGFAIEAVLEREPHPEEAQTQRTYVLARRR